MRETKEGTSLLEIFSVFFKLGSISFGGGYAMVPLIEHEIVEMRHWMDHKKIIDVFAVAGSLPGALGLNAAALVGYNIAGISGALAATIGNLTPSVIIVLSLSILFTKFSTNAFIQSAFGGIRPAVLAIIIFAAYKIGKVVLTDRKSLMIALLAFGGMLIHIHPFLLIAFGAIAGLWIHAVRVKQ